MFWLVLADEDSVLTVSRLDINLHFYFIFFYYFLFIDVQIWTWDNVTRIYPPGLHSLHLFRDGSYKESDLSWLEEVNIYKGSENGINFLRTYSKEFKVTQGYIIYFTKVFHH